MMSEAEPYFPLYLTKDAKTTLFDLVYFVLMLAPSSNILTVRATTHRSNKTTANMKCEILRYIDSCINRNKRRHDCFSLLVSLSNSTQSTAIQYCE